jgi:hypothetical protein
MKHVAFLSLALITTIAPTYSVAQRSKMAVESKDGVRIISPSSVAGISGGAIAGIVIATLSLTRDETWLYNTDTGVMTAQRADLPATLAAAGQAPIAQAAATKPIAGVGIVLKKNCPKCKDTERRAGPSDGTSLPAPLDATKPMAGVGIVIKSNSSSSAERRYPLHFHSFTSADGRATTPQSLEAGTYDVSLTIPPEELPTSTGKAPLLLNFQIIVQPTGTASSAYCAASGAGCATYDLAASKK